MTEKYVSKFMAKNAICARIVKLLIHYNAHHHWEAGEREALGESALSGGEFLVFHPHTDPLGVLDGVIQTHLLQFEAKSSGIYSVE